MNNGSLMKTAEPMLMSCHPRRSPFGVSAGLHCGLAISLLLTSSLALGTAFTDQANGFSVTPPAGWKQSTVPGATAYFSAPVPVDGVTSNLNVIVKTLPSASTLNDFASLSSGEVAKAFPGAVEDKTYNGTLDGQPAATTAYTLPVKGRTLVSVQTIVIVGKRVYVLTGVTAETNARAFGAVNAAFIKSFRFLK